MEVVCFVYCQVAKWRSRQRHRKAAVTWKCVACLQGFRSSLHMQAAFFCRHHSGFLLFSSTFWSRMRIRGEVFLPSLPNRLARSTPRPHKCVPRECVPSKEGRALQSWWTGLDWTERHHRIKRGGSKPRGAVSRGCEWPESSNVGVHTIIFILYTFKHSFMHSFSFIHSVIASIQRWSLY